MATRTAPTVASGAETKIGLTLHLVDASGDLYSEYIEGLGAVTDAEIEAWAASYQAISQASLYQVTQSLVWQGDVDPDNADAGYRGTISDGINLLYRNLVDNTSVTPRVVAPAATIMQGNQDIPLLSAGAFVTYLTAQSAIFNGVMSLVSAQFTGRRERKNNPRIRV